MCIGIPMQVLDSGEGYAICCARDSDERRHVDMLLVGDLPKGSWVLVFLGAAREVLDEITAHQISDALTALELAMHGDGQIDHLFADLVNREPQLPEFLRPQLPRKESA
jgi:hydrogenase assembly chaperone HypC/HupF